MSEAITLCPIDPSAIYILKHCTDAYNARMEISTLRTFVDVMRRGSFAAVARDRDVDPSSISRAIAALEQALGVRLFQRSTRRLVPTEAGTVYFARIEPAIEELERAQSTVADFSDSPKGLLRVTAPVTCGQVCLVPLLPEFAAMYPELSFELLLTDGTVDLLAERIDVALRLGPLSDSAYVAHRLYSMTFVVCASPRYLKRHGSLRTPHDIEHHDCLLFPLPGYNTQWRFKSAKGAVTKVPVHGRYTISNALALRECALNDMGVTLLPRWVIGNELRDGSLINLFPNHDVTPTSFDTAAWLLYPSRRYLPLKVRVFVDYLKRKFRAGLPWEKAS